MPSHPDEGAAHTCIFFIHKHQQVVEDNVDFTGLFLPQSTKTVPQTYKWPSQILLDYCMIQPCIWELLWAKCIRCNIQWCIYNKIYNKSIVTILQLWQAPTPSYAKHARGDWWLVRVSCELGFLSSQWSIVWGLGLWTRDIWCSKLTELSSGIFRLKDQQTLIGITHPHVSNHNTLRPRQNGCYFADNIFKCIILSCKTLRSR